MRLKEWMQKNRVSYQKLADAVGSTPRALHRWSLQDAPSSVYIAYNIVKATKGEVTLEDLAQEYLDSEKFHNNEDS